jgi:2-iminobutanoate/2-iminopropanoate deaminase
MKEIRTDNAPAPVGPYSQAQVSGKLVFCSGQIPLDPKTNEMVGTTAAAQAEQVLKNMEAVLIASGASMDRVVKTQIFMVDLKAFAEVNAIYEKAFRGHRPARSTVQVAALPKGALVEIECVAELG